jgi:hypothetical protein
MGVETRETGERKARAAQRAHRKGAQLIGEGGEGESLHEKTKEYIETLLMPDADSCESNKEWKRTFMTLANTCLSSDQASSLAMWYIHSPSLSLSLFLSLKRMHAQRSAVLTCAMGDGWNAHATGK